MAIGRTEIRNWSIYRITSPSGRVYIGLTSNMDKRMSVYRCNFSKRQAAIYQSIKKYGFPAHNLKVIDTFSSDVGYANGKEMFWIKTYMSNKNKYPDQNGLNLNDGGGTNIGFKPSAESIEKGRQKKIGRKASEETKEKMRKIMTGRKMNFTHLTPEFRKMVSERNTGYRHTDESKRKIAAASKGNKFAVGYKMTPEQIEHRSSLIRGTRRSDEAKQASRKTFMDRYSRKILQFSLDGIFIKEYDSVTDAGNELKIWRANISKVLQGARKAAGGFIFKYKDDIGFRNFKFKRRVFIQKDISQILNKVA